MEGELNKKFQQLTGLNFIDIEKIIADASDDEAQQKAYDFIHWNIKQGRILEMDKFAELAEDIESAIASFVTEESKTYTVTFKNGEETVKTVTGVTGTAVEVPASPEKEGHTFAGWSTDGETVIIPIANIGEADVIYIAVWNEVQQSQTYTVTFKDGETVIGEPITGVTGTAVEVPASPEKEGHTFAGWSTDGETVIIPIANIGEADVTYIAVWEEVEEPQEP